jgi:hypothetical protein
MKSVTSGCSIDLLLVLLLIQIPSTSAVLSPVLSPVLSSVEGLSKGSGHRLGFPVAPPHVSSNLTFVYDRAILN